MCLHGAYNVEWEVGKPSQTHAHTHRSEIVNYKYSKGEMHGAVKVDATAPNPKSYPAGHCTAWFSRSQLPTLRQWEHAA